MLSEESRALRCVAAAFGHIIALGEGRGNVRRLIDSCVCVRAYGVALIASAWLRASKAQVDIT
jgi:hypothetical protein